MLEGRAYVPLLHTRLAEIRALRELEPASKNLLVPVISLRPWLNSKTLDRAVDVIEEAVGNRLYGLDLDESRFERNPDPQKEARVEFSKLFREEGGYKSYYELVASGDNRVPVFRGLSSDKPRIEEQLDHVTKIDRGLFVRASPLSPGSVLDVAREVRRRDIDNVVFVIDCGWGRDILTHSVASVVIIQQIVDVNESFEIVVAGSSFPDAFSDLGNQFSHEIRERSLFQEVRRQLNEGILIYGDWGSTRPPSDPVPMRNVPRIDSARPQSWPSWRSEGGESYADVAQRAIRDREWDGRLGVWGEYMVEATANGEDVCIKSPAMAAAVRVNLHLHQQAHFDNPGGLHLGDEPVEDEL